MLLLHVGNSKCKIRIKYCSFLAWKEDLLRNWAGAIKTISGRNPGANKQHFGAGPILYQKFCFWQQLENGRIEKKDFQESWQDTDLPQGSFCLCKIVLPVPLYFPDIWVDALSNQESLNLRCILRQIRKQSDLVVIENTLLLPMALLWNMINHIYLLKVLICLCNSKIYFAKIHVTALPQDIPKEDVRKRSQRKCMLWWEE